MPQYQTIFDTLTAITKKDLTIITSNNQSQTVVITKSTKFTQKTSDSKIEDLKPTDLTPNSTVIVSTLPDAKKPEILNAVFLHLLPATP